MNKSNKVISFLLSIPILGSMLHFISALRHLVRLRSDVLVLRAQLELLNGRVEDQGVSGATIGRMQKEKLSEMESQISNLHKLVSDLQIERAVLANQIKAVHDGHLSLNHVVRIEHADHLTNIEARYDNRFNDLNGQHLDLNHVVRVENEARLSALDAKVGRLSELEQRFIELSHEFETTVIEMQKSSVADEKAILRENAEYLASLSRSVQPSTPAPVVVESQDRTNSTVEIIEDKLMSLTNKMSEFKRRTLDVKS